MEQKLLFSFLFLHGEFQIEIVFILNKIMNQ